MSRDWKTHLARPELFVTALTENLMTFALGRGVEHTMPAVRKVSEDVYKWISFLVADSRHREERPFQMRHATKEDPAPGTIASSN